MSAKLSRITISDCTISSYAPYAVLIVAVLLAYADVYNNAFLYDDLFLIVGNGHLRDWHALPGFFVNPTLGHFYRPLQETLYLIVYQIAGLSPPAFHLLNVGLHALNTCLVYKLGRKLAFNLSAVFSAALLWGLHPIHTEAVTYMSATADVLFVSFCLAGLLAVLPDFTPRRILIASGWFVLALLSKESALVFPALVVICLYCARNQSLNLRQYLVTWPLWSVALLYLLIRSVAMPFGAGTAAGSDPVILAYSSHMLPRLYTALATLPSYSGLLLWPTALHMDRDFPYVFTASYWPVWLGGLMVLASVALVVFTRTHPRLLPLCWGLLWFAAAHFPQTGILIPVNSLFLEHWMYLPSVGLIVGGAETLSRALKKQVFKKAVVTATGVAALLLGFLTFDQNKIWHDPSVFFQNILAHHENDLRVRNHLALALMQQGDDRKAIGEFNKIITLIDAGNLLKGVSESDSTYIMYVQAYNNLGILYAKRGDDAAAIAAFRKSVAASSDFAEPQKNLAWALCKQSQSSAQISEAISHIDRALEIDPDQPDAYDMLAMIYERLGKHGKAATDRAKAAEIRQRLGIGDAGSPSNSFVIKQF